MSDKNAQKHEHDAATGRFVSEEYAEANPDTTVSVTENPETSEGDTK